MRYIVNDSGQVLEVSFGATIVCGDRGCTEYTGLVPDGYDSLGDWFAQECDKLYRWKIVEGNLVKQENAPEPASVQFGYCEPMAWLGFDASTWSSTGTFQEDLEAVFATLPQGCCMQVQFIDSNLNGQKHTGTLWRYTSSYGVLSSINYSGVKAVKTLYDGKWGPWEWENPDMVTGTEYRTTERYGGAVVYAKNISLGKLPNNTEKTVEHGISGVGTLVSFKVFAYETSSSVVRQVPFFTSAGVLRADAYVTSARVGVVTQADMSGYTAIAQLRYTKS